MAKQGKGDQLVCNICRNKGDAWFLHLYFVWITSFGTYLLHWRGERSKESKYDHKVSVSPIRVGGGVCNSLLLNSEQGPDALLIATSLSFLFSWSALCNHPFSSQCKCLPVAATFSASHLFPYSYRSTSSLPFSSFSFLSGCVCSLFLFLFPSHLVAPRTRPVNCSWTGIDVDIWYVCFSCGSTVFMDLNWLTLLV